MAANQFAVERLKHIGDREVPLICCHFGIEQNLQKQIAEFFRQMCEISALNRIEDLVGLLKRVLADGIERLLTVPRAAAWSTQASHDGYRLLKQRRRSRRIGNRLRRGICCIGTQCRKIHAPPVYLAGYGIECRERRSIKLQTASWDHVPIAYTRSAMIGTYGWILAGLLGLVFGSFLNTCASRWPNDESAIKPRSHCRSCGRTLAWWENVPLVSWLVLRGRCRSCGAWVNWRYPLVELAVGVLWAAVAWRILTSPTDLATSDLLWAVSIYGLAQMILLWLLVALAVLDFENLWLPNKITIPGTLLGFAATVMYASVNSKRVFAFYGALELRSHFIWHAVGQRLLAILAAAGLILLIRWTY